MKKYNFIRTNKKITYLILLFCISFGYSQEKRKAFTLQIAADKEHYYKAEIPESPYFVKDKILQIYCGEKILIECEIKSDTIASMKFVSKNTHPEKTIEINFTQSTENTDNIITMLEVVNPFDKKLIYEAIMFTPIKQQWQPTSIIPIQPKLTNFETWPHGIVTLVLENWHFE
ncbi:conserved hypothetical protein [Flavobacterium sp. 9AF]|uniref:hypothetical protein n=1 Tax=Flavobacterium sp. 9AF TaxID=2653142 RepID=UPI0012F08A81|nr:hypothetical protein [Flavobacterium sp. 9AF]VXC33845.1 conserved hypothetical protein [Flavobacterium sp. 9AF]